MLKILYAASENANSKIQLSRFLQAIKNSPHTIKVAAYKVSSPNGINIDWTLDALKNIFKPEYVTLDNDNFVTYYNQVKYYNPDLIISDCEYYTSHIASVLGTTIWQCSSSIINFALTNDYKYNLGLFSKYAYLINKGGVHLQRVLNILDNSNCNFIYSHFGDTINPPKLKDNFEWIRPYHKIGKESILCHHNVVAGTLGNNKKILSLLKQYPDSVCFTEFMNETYENPILKDIRSQEEFSCNLRNSNLFVCEGQTSFLADAFYNSKYSGVFINLEDTECVINSTISERLKLSTSIYQINEDLIPLMSIDVSSQLSEKIKYLHERIEEL